MSKQFEGIIVSTKMQNTVVVQVKREAAHPLYRKIVRSTKRFLAHVEGMEVKLGDMVKIVEIRPMSKNKRFKVTEVMKKA